MISVSLRGSLVCTLSVLVYQLNQVRSFVCSDGGGHLLQLLDTSVTTPEDFGSPDHNCVLLRIIRRIVTWDLKDGGNSGLVLNNHVPDSLGCSLGNQDNADVGPGEVLAKIGVNLLVSSVALDNHEVFHTTFVAFTHAREQQTSDSGRVSDGGDQECSFTILASSHFDSILITSNIK